MRYVIMQLIGTQYLNLIHTITMIPIKQHNDIVQQLMKELTTKENQLKLANKEKSKAVQPPIESNTNEKMLNTKINQLNKEYKQKIGNLTQQLRSKSIQNKDLKERLTAKTNMEVKQKDHIAEILKKNYDRKPSSAADYKISALIKHYQDQITSKNNYIEQLQKQLKSLQSKQTHLQVNQNYQQGVENEDKMKGITLVEHQREVGRYKLEMNKYKKLHQQKQKEYKDLSKRYSELTNQYYKIINAYGLQQKQISIKPKQQKTSRKELHSKLKVNALQNLLQEMVVSDSEYQQNPSLQYQPRQVRVKPNHFCKQDFETQDLQVKQDLATSKLQQIISILQVKDPRELIPKLSKWKTQMQQYQLVDTVCRSLQAFFYNIGKGKISKKDLVQALQDLEKAYQRNLEAVDLLDQLCIEVGAKREKLKQKVEQVMRIKGEYFEQLKNLKYTKQLGKANKVIEFIEFFELDKQQLALPQQLAQIQKQLKSINKYVKEVRAILEIDQQKSHQMVLELALRYMENASSFMSQYEKRDKNSRG